MTTKNLTVRELAWEALKQTRNPEYVSIRYQIPVEKLRDALEKIPTDEPMFRTLARASTERASSTFKRPSDLLPEVTSGKDLPGEND